MCAFICAFYICISQNINNSVYQRNVVKYNLEVVVLEYTIFYFTVIT